MTEPRPYDTPWPYPGTPDTGDTIRIGSMENATVTHVTPDLIILDNGRAFRR